MPRKVLIPNSVFPSTTPSAVVTCGRAACPSANDPIEIDKTVMNPPSSFPRGMQAFSKVFDDITAFRVACRQSLLRTRVEYFVVHATLIKWTSVLTRSRIVNSTAHFSLPWAHGLLRGFQR